MTNADDKQLQQRLDRLAEMRGRPKFGEDIGTFYPGAADESVRAEYQGHIDIFLDRLKERLQHEPLKESAFEEMRRALQHFEEADSEDRDRVCAYMEDVMDILGIETSEGLLNEWRYGFDPNGAANNA